MTTVIDDDSTSHDSAICYLTDKLNYLKFERILQLKHFGKGNNSHKHILSKTNSSNLYYEKLTKKIIYDKLKTNTYNYISNSTYGYVDHHLYHAFSIDFIEKKPCDVYIIIDNATRWMSIFRDGILIKTFLQENTNGRPAAGLHHLGMLLNIKGLFIDIPGKLMGLQSYGSLDKDHYDKLSRYSSEFLGDKDCFKSINGRRPEFIKNERHLFSVPDNSNILNITHTIHKKMGDIILDIFERYARPHERIGYAGGLAQNVIWNTMLKKKYPNLVVYPHCGDEGTVLGLLEFLQRYKNFPNTSLSSYPFCQSDEIPNTTPSIDTIHKTAKYLANGKIVAWYQGAGEIGPRALGHRSILMDPRVKNGKDIINRVKNREYYRPFGASVLEEYAKEYFDLDFPNPYMLYVGNTQKDNLKAITHVDGTCRAQTVDSSCDYFRILLEHFFELTGCPVLLNTSLNESGKPIAGWIQNAMNEFINKPIDVLVVGDSIYTKPNV